MANDVADPSIGFDSDQNAVTVIARDGSSTKIERAPIYSQGLGRVCRVATGSTDRATRTLAQPVIHAPGRYASTIARWYVTVDLDRRLTGAESSALFAALEADPRVSDPGPVGNGMRYGGFMHFDVDAESANQAAELGQVVTAETLARADLRSAYEVHELTDPSGAILSVGDFDG